MGEHIAGVLHGVRERFAQQGVEVEASTPEQFTALLQKELPRWAQIIKAAKIQGE